MRWFCAFLHSPTMASFIILLWLFVARRLFLFGFYSFICDLELNVDQIGRINLKVRQTFWTDFPVELYRNICIFFAVIFIHHSPITKQRKQQQQQHELTQFIVSIVPAVSHRRRVIFAICIGPFPMDENKKNAFNLFANKKGRKIFNFQISQKVKTSERFICIWPTNDLNGKCITKCEWFI